MIWDGDITANVVTGKVDVYTPGDYVHTCKGIPITTKQLCGVSYTYKIPVNQIQAEDNKTIYLTFDDGPAHIRNVY